MSVRFSELNNSPREFYGPEGFRATRIILCDWVDRNFLVAELMSVNYQFGRSTYPFHKDVVAATIEVIPYQEIPTEAENYADIIRDINTFPGKAQITIKYEQVPILPDGGFSLPNKPRISWFVYERKNSVIRWKLPKGLSRELHWASDAAVVGAGSEVIGRIYWVPLVLHNLSWRRVDVVPWDVIDNCTGTINSEVFLGHPAGQLLFEGVDNRREYITRGDRFDTQPFWRVDMIFRQRKITAFRDIVNDPIGWNHQFRLGDPISWDRALDDNDRGLYYETDFNLIFVD